MGARKIAPGKEGGREAAVFDARTLAFLKEQLDQATIVRHPKGKVVMKEGESGANMYIVLEGRVDISIRNNVVELVGPGGTFGEMALVDQSPRTASAVTQEECVLLAISRSALIGLVRAQPAFGVALLRGVADRLRYMNSLLA